MLKWKPLEISVKNFNAQMILEEAVYNPIKCTNDNLQRHMQDHAEKEYTEVTLKEPNLIIILLKHI